MKTTSKFAFFLALIAGGTACAQIVTNGSFNGTAIPGANISPSLYFARDKITSQVGNTWDYIYTDIYNSVSLWDFDSMPSLDTESDGSLDPFGTIHQSADGGQFAVFYGESLSQTLSGFQPNTIYDVSFEMANMNIGFKGGTPFISATDAIHSSDEHFAVSLSNTVQSTLNSPTLNYITQSDINKSELGPWSKVTLQFTTNATVTPATNLTLVFSHKIGPNYQPSSYLNNLGGQLALDGVSITQAVPEPSSALLLLGAGAFGLSLRRRGAWHMGCSA